MITQKTKKRKCCACNAAKIKAAIKELTAAYAAVQTLKRHLNTVLPVIKEEETKL